jgi:micrococcal nuclease
VGRAQFVRTRLVVFGLLAAWAWPAAAMVGVVTRVSDGDTLWVRPDSGGRPVKLRVHGIDAPERCQAWGPEAQQRLQALVLGREVRLVEGVLDSHGRRLARLMLGREDIGRHLVLEGLAWSHRYRGWPGPYATEEAVARRERRGLFADPGAMPPREFRRTHGPCT